MRKYGLLARLCTADSLRSSAEADVVTQQFTWHARVPIASNFADDLSRLEQDGPGLSTVRSEEFAEEEVRRGYTAIKG